MKRLCLLFAACLTVAPALFSKTVELVVIAGQSNAQGWQGNAARYPADSGKTDATIPFWYRAPGASSGDKWITLGPQTGRFKAGHFGPEVSFARTLKQDMPTLAVFKYAFGSTGLAADWKAPGGKGLYDAMTKDFRKAVAAMEARGDKVHVACLVWIQGESDAANAAVAKAYEANLRRLVTDFRSNVAKDANVPVILGLDEQHPWVKKFPVVITAQEHLAKSLPRVIRTSMVGLAKADVSHLTPKALGDHGLRLAEAYRKVASPAK